MEKRPVNVNELMVKIREEIAQRSQLTNESDIPIENNIHTQIPNTMDQNMEETRQLISLAEGEIDVGSKVTSMEHFRYKFIRYIARFVGKIVLYLARFITAKQRRYNRYVVDVLKQVIIKIESFGRSIITGVNQEIQQINEILNNEIENIRISLNGLKEEHHETHTMLEGLSETHYETRSMLEGLSEAHHETRSMLEGLSEAHHETRSILEGLSGAHHETRTMLEGLSGAHHETRTILENKFMNLSDFLRQLENKLTENEYRLNQLNENHNSTINSLFHETQENKINIIDQHRRLTLLLEEARKRFPEKIEQEQIKNMISEEQHLLDAMYVSFEDRFRGPREEIKNKQAVYLSYIKQVINNKQSKGLILDVGCGRCEWLEVLKENNFSAIGVDINRIFIEQGKENGYEVVESDVIEYLRKQKANSFSVVTGFHIVEHLEQKTLVKLLDESFRVLQAGGMIIFETPNPENIIVGACNFYTDPTHKKPIPPHNLLFLTEARGFCRAEIIRLHPDKQLQNELKMLKVNDVLIPFFTKEQDYSIIAYKR